jgi:hypothetical protein
MNNRDAEYTEFLIKNIIIPKYIIEGIMRDISLNYDLGVQSAEKAVNTNIIGLPTNTLDELKRFSLELIKDMTNDLAEDIRKTVKLHNFEGSSQQDLNNKLTKTLDKYIQRAKTIAVTETTRAYNIGALTAAIASGVVIKKYWLSIIDDRTTSYCLYMSSKYNQKNAIPIEEPFIDELGTKIMGPPGHYNCRSVVAFVM